MDAYKAILSKRDTRSFLPEPVDDDDLRAVLQAARMAGSAKNEQRNRVVVVTDQADRHALAKCGDFSDWIPSAPAILVLVRPGEKGRPFDLGRMAQNAMLAANSRGLASCPVSFQRPACVRDALGVPDDYEPVMGVGIGRPAAADPERHTSPRLPLDDVVHWGRWKG